MLYRVFSDETPDHLIEELAEKNLPVKVGERLPIVENGVESQREVTKVSGPYTHNNTLALDVWVK